MSKLFSWLIIGPMTVALIVFSVVNRHPVTVDFWPLDLTPQIRLFVVVLGVLIIGVLWGGLVAWIAGANGRRRARESARRAAAAEREARRMKDKIAELESAARRGQSRTELPAPADAA